MDRRMRRRIRRNIKKALLMAMTIMAAYLVLAGLGLIETLGTEQDWLPAQICMIVVGSSWIHKMLAETGAFNRCE